MLSQHAAAGHPGYASIMVPVDLSSGNENRIKVALDLADAFGARLVGVGAREVNFPTYGLEGAYFDTGLQDDEQRRAERELDSAEAQFRRIARTRNSVEWRGSLMNPSAYVEEQARAADLIVVTRQGVDDPPLDNMSVRTGDLVMTAGRPVLSMPPHMTHLSLTKILVAWKDTREARRAVWDSLPILRRAESVVVAAVGDETGRTSAADVAAYLSAHAVRHTLPVVLHPEAEMTESEALRRFASAEGAQLIVAGAYGHSRMREWLFGGMTRDLLRESPTPCLFAH